jgi:hypothetical protein
MGEPFRVAVGAKKKAAEFVPGTIPEGDGADAPAGDSSGGAASHLPVLTSFSALNRVVFAGQANSKIVGRLSTTASAVALAFDTGTGYWVVPAGDPDTTSEGELTWQALASYSPDIVPGYHELTAAPVGPGGVWGKPLKMELCIAGRTPDHLNACEPTLAPPNTVFSLSWDTNVDLDLRVLTPSGRMVSAKRPTTLALNGDGTVPEDAGTIDRDSNAACVIDGIRYENLVFENNRPAEGTWGIYVDLFDSCQKPVVHFTASVYVSKVGKDGNRHLEEIGSHTGILLASQATGGSSQVGTYLFEVSF